MSNSSTPPATPSGPLVGAKGVVLTLDTQTGVGHISGSYLYLDGTTPPIPDLQIRALPLQYGVAEIPDLVSKIAARIAANNNQATDGDLAQIVAFAQAVLGTPDPPRTAPAVQVFAPPDLL